VWQAIRAAEAGTPPDPWREPPAVFAELRAGESVDEASVSAAEGV
jgi:carbon-monoxide dehydrogenase large subunit